MQISSFTLASMLGLALTSMSMVDVRAGELTILAGGGITGPMRELGPRFERATGHKLAFFFGTTPELIKQATSGNPFDAGVVPQEVFKDTGAQAKFVAGPTTEIARVGLGVAVRAGAAKPDIGTPDAMKETLLKAQSIATVPGERRRRAGPARVRASRHRRSGQGEDQGAGLAGRRWSRPSRRARPSSACFSAMS